VKEDEVGRIYSTHVEKRKAYRVSVRRPAGKRPLGRPRRGRKYYIKNNLRESGWGVMNWIHLAQDRTGSFEYGNKLSGSITCLEILE
jgi:hypothetical protein